MATYSHTTASSQPLLSTDWWSLSRKFVKEAQSYRFGWDVTLLSLQSLASLGVLVSIHYGQGADWQFLVAIVSFMLILAPILSAQSMRFLFRSAIIALLVQTVIIVMNVLR